MLFDSACDAVGDFIDNIFTTYHCVSCLNSKLQKVELEELLEGEVFDKISNKEGDITNCDIKLSEHYTIGEQTI